MSRKDDRLFKANDLWRIYCNHLTEIEQLKFKNEFNKEGGRCDEERDPCIDVEESMVSGKDEILAYERSIQEAREILDRSYSYADDTIGAIGDWFDALSTELDAIRDSNNEASLEQWDELLGKSVPDPIERARLSAGIQEITQNIMLGGFAKSANFAQELLRKQGLWQPRGELIVLTKRATDTSAKIALGVLVFFKAMYDTFVEDCVDERRW